MNLKTKADMQAIALRKTAYTIVPGGFQSITRDNYNHSEPKCAEQSLGYFGLS